MILRKLGVVLAAALVVSAVTAGTSQAMYNVPEGGGTTGSGYHSPINAEATGELVLAGSAGGSKVKIKATGLTAIESEIAQNATLAQVIGKFGLTGVSVVEPAGCKTASSLETVPLTGTLQMGNSEATKSGLYTKFVPTSGEVFVTIKLTGCAVEGSYQLKGTLYGKNTNGTGVLAVRQGITFTGAINSSQGGTLTLGKEAATFEGGFSIGLTSGASFTDLE